MFKKLKMCLAAFVAAALTVTGTGCTIGKSTAVAMTIDGYDVKSGVYIFYQNSALEEAKNKLLEEDSEFNTDDEEALKAAKVEDMGLLEWVEKKTFENCLEFVAVNKKFDELKLTLDDTEKKNINDSAEHYYGEENNSNIYYFNGIGRESFKEIVANTYKSNAVFDALYGKDGSENVKSEDVKKFYLDNTSRVKYIKLDLTDADGNDMDDAGKKEVKELADKLLDEVKDKKGEELLTAFDDIKTEYDDFVAAKSAETSESDGEDASSETTETTVAASEETTEAAEEAETEETEAVSEEEATEEETEAAEEENSEESEDTDSEDEETAETEAPEENGDTTETTVSTAPEGEEETTETTTTPDPHANESLVSKVTTDKDTKEEDVSYTPCKKVHDWAFDDKNKNEEPTIIEDDTAYYVIVKLDLEERMTEDDLWTEDRDESIRYNMYDDEYHDKLSEWGDEYKKKEFKVNDSAVNRYKPFSYREPETTVAKKETEPMY